MGDQNTNNEETGNQLKSGHWRQRDGPQMYIQICT